MTRTQPWVDPQDLETARHTWAVIANENGWYHEPFFVQVWVDPDGHVVDSVAYRDLDHDVVLVNDV